MQLFAKERKSRKKEMQKLQQQLDQKQKDLEIEELKHKSYKIKVMENLEKETEKHSEYYKVMH